MKILLVNVDSRWNMAIRKMYNYYRKTNEVDMIDLGFSGYPHKRYEVIDASNYDKVFVSNIALFLQVGKMVRLTCQRGG